jgi:hypothetical protein
VSRSKRRQRLDGGWSRRFSVPIPYWVPIDPLRGWIGTEDAIRTENHRV